MKKLLITTLIFILTINLVPAFVNDSVTAQEKSTNISIYTQGDPIDITIKIPGGTNLYEQPANIVLVLDRSISMLKPMGGDKTVRIKAAVKALEEFLKKANPAKHRIAFATFGSAGYWHVNFTTNYKLIKDKLKKIEKEIKANKGKKPFPYGQWECTSNGDGLRLAVDKLIADGDTDPDFVVLASDGAENGQLNQVDSLTGEVFTNVKGHTSSFIEDNKAVVDAKKKGIKIYTIGISSEVLEDYSGKFEGIPKDSEAYLGRKCGRIYRPSNFGYRTGESLLKDHIATPTGGIYSKVLSTSALEDVYIDILDDIVGALDIQVYDQIRSDIFNNITAIDPTPGCSGDDKYVSGSLKDGVGTRGFKDARYNQLEDDEEACIKISTTVKNNSLTGLQDVDVRHNSCPAAIPINSGCIKILTTGAWIDGLKAQIEVLPAIWPWLKTTGGDVGSIGVIGSINRDLVGGPYPVSGEFNAEYLVISGDVSNNIDLDFISDKEWIIDQYGGLSISPDTNGYDALYKKYTQRCSPLPLTGEKPKNIKEDVGEDCNILKYDGDYETDEKWEQGEGYKGKKPAVVFITGEMKITKNMKIKAKTGLIFVVKGAINIDKEVKRVDGIFITDGEFNTYKGIGCGDTSIAEQLVINGAVYVFGSGEACFTRRLGDTSPKPSDRFSPSETINFEPKYLWLFQEILDDTEVIYRELAP